MPSSQLVSQAPSLAPIDLTMSLITSSCNASKAVKTGNVINLTLPDNPNLRAILFPKSKLALYFTRLQENDSVLFLIEENICLLSPDVSFSEDESSLALNEDTSKS